MGPFASKVIDLIYAHHTETQRFIRQGKWEFVWLVILSLAIIVSRLLLPFFCLRFLGISASLRDFFNAQTALTFLIFFAPTPGAAGIAEAASMAILGGFVPADRLPIYNLLWRFSSSYLPTVIGLVVLGQSLAQDAARSYCMLSQPEAKTPVTASSFQLERIGVADENH
jgi:uncharacterized protein (TIRG00374 family)